jgi:hypothetical protein
MLTVFANCLLSVAILSVARFCTFLVQLSLHDGSNFAYGNLLELLLSFLDAYLELAWICRNFAEIRADLLFPVPVVAKLQKFGIQLALFHFKNSMPWTICATQNSIPFVLSQVEDSNEA